MHLTNFSGIGGLDMLLCLIGYQVKGRELLSLISKHNIVGKYILFLFCITQCALECVQLYMLSIGLLGITG